MNLKNPFQKNIYRVTSSKKADIQKCDHELENVYNALLFHTIDTIKQLGATDILDIWVIVNLMCQNGCFSYNKNEWNDCFSNNSPKSLEILVKHKFFLNGHGVCRHASVFLQKIYSLLGYDSSIMIGFFNSIFNSKDTIKTKPHDEAKRYIEEYFSNRKNSIRDIEFQQDFRSIEISTGNHMVTSVNAEDKTYLFDLTQHIAYTTLYPDILHTDWNYFFIPYKKITEKKVKEKIYTTIPKIKIYEYANGTDLNGIESLEQNYKDYLKQVRLYSTFYEKNKHLLEKGERNIQALRKHFSE